uniref:Ketoreductase domain-containing protein n=1 Tax=Entomoneis paludosa TaxID=265537 RepID=A0A7S2YCX8_9STRA|mmetsp:Transcript_27835/g.58270  ORF Transcript_27835/g.58270 Transcript_27835/m.58270 type:complete len:273 (+) Transcript_27835:51-869(+)
MAASSAASTLFSVAGKNVLVTGGSRGIGYMIAKGFQEQGANVLLTSRSEEACQKAAQELNCHYVASNVSNREGCEALADHVGQVFDQGLHVLVNNAGTSWGEPLSRKSGRANWGFDKVFDLNVKGLFYLTRACLPHLEAAASTGDPARIINIGSVAGQVPQAVPTHAYDASKAAVHQLTRKFAADFAPKGITCNALAPGFVPSRMSDGLATWGGDQESLASHIPLARMGNEDDMAGACIYLSSRAGAWVTGTVLTVDGGTVGALQLNLTSDL